MVSKKQKAIYDFVGKHLTQKGYIPSLEEIAKKFKLASPSAAHYHIKKLTEAGYLEREPGKGRSIKVYESNGVKSPFLAEIGLDSIRIPVVGSANCGAANLLAEENVEGYLKISRQILNRRDGIFALRADGDSMNRADIGGKAIDDGDYVIIDSENCNPRDGDYVLSIIDGYANLKRFRVNHESGQIWLESESSNPSHKPIYVSSEDDFMVNGKVLAVVKK